jgi:peptidoglycan/LPS O-acetylase OafA/YrhL
MRPGTNIKSLNPVQVIHTKSFALGLWSIVGQMRTKKIEFRADIAALRALAVMIVMFSHFGIPGFEFGFIGVDIFFVISGYLITRILYKDYLSKSQGADNMGTLALGTFYLRRIRRLLPAALFVIILVNIVSYFLYNAESRNELLMNSKWALLFLANVSFLRSGSDYFQQSSEPSMLQHYWSLSVEEQFYFIWPVLFLIAASAHKMKALGKYFRFNKRILSLIGIISIASYLFLLFGFKIAPVEAYFSIFSRAWELGIGSFLGILAFQKKKDTVFSRTEVYFPLIFALLICAFAINEENWALLMPIPVIATGFLLYAGEGQKNSLWINSRLTQVTGRFVLYLGTISYSLYLVHWPVYIVGRHLGWIDGALSRFSLIPISIMIAHLLWKFIEIPFQNIPLPKRSKFEDLAFNFLKLRKLWIGALAFCLVGSLYVVTYPNVTERLVFSDSKLKGLADDPALLKYANYQANLLNPNSVPSDSGLTVSTEETTTISVVSLEDLIKLNTKMLEQGLSQTKISEIAKTFLQRVDSDLSPFERSACPSTDSIEQPNCPSGVRIGEQKTVALIGDSKIGQFAQPLIEYFTKRGWKVEPYILDGCHMFSPTNDFKKNCTKRSEWVLSEVKNRKFDLVIASSYPTDAPTLSRSSDYIDTIIKASKRTILLTQFPKVQAPKKCINEDLTYQKSCSDINSVETSSYVRYKALLGSKTSATTSVVDTTKWTCIELMCPIVVGDVFLNRDGNHLTYTFIKKITPIINLTLDSIANW